VPKNSRTPWAYRKGKGFLYTIPTGIKLIFFLGLSLAIFIFDYSFLPIGIGIIILLSISAKIRPWELLKGSLPIVMLVMGITVFQALEINPLMLKQESLFDGLVLGLRMILSFSAGALLFSVTTMCEIRRSLSSAEKFFHLEKLRISLAISLMLGFIPRFFAIWEDTELAWKSRCGKNGIRKVITIVPIIMDRLMAKAAETAEALESRGIRDY
jgi:energy-coupling factor transporter transmembrane protein EcfT